MKNYKDKEIRNKGEIQREWNIMNRGKEIWTHVLVKIDLRFGKNKIFLKNGPQ